MNRSALIRWDPFKEMQEAQNRMAGFLGLMAPRAAHGQTEALTVAQWSPSVDITEDDKEYLVKTDLPEVKKEDLSVTVEHGVLTIAGERKFEKEETGRKFHRIERSHGNFLRAFTLPEGTDAAKVSGEFKDGVLKVRLPKSEKAKPKSIEVKAA